MFICDFHREQAWERWLSKASNRCREIKTEVLALLRWVARSLTLETSESAIKALKESQIWRNKSNSRLVDYIERVWLKVKQVIIVCEGMQNMRLLFTPLHGKETPYSRRPL